MRRPGSVVLEAMASIAEAVLVGLRGMPVLAAVALDVTLYVGYEFAALKETDQAVRQVDLTAQEAVPGRRRAEVVIVVPAFAHREHADDRVVFAPIACVFERLLSP